MVGDRGDVNRQKALTLAHWFTSQMAAASTGLCTQSKLSTSVAGTRSLEPSSPIP